MIPPLLWYTSLQLIDGGNQERMRIPVISITGNYPQYKRYVLDYHKNPRSKKIPGYLQAAERAHFARVAFRSCCDCTDNCMDKNKCMLHSTITLSLATAYQFVPLESLMLSLLQAYVGD